MPITIPLATYIRAELARIDKARTDIHRQFHLKPFAGWI